MQKSLISVLLVAALVAGTQGLSCYSCYDVKGISSTEPLEGMTPHTSCEHGKTPENSLRVACTPDNSTGTVIQPICVQAYGTVNMNNANVQAIARGCAHVIPAQIPRDECIQSNIGNLKRATVGPMRDALNHLTSEYDAITDSTSGTFCHCNSDNCNNPAPMVTPGSMAVVAVGAVLVAMKSMF